MVWYVNMPYSKDKYIIRQQQQKIRNLEAQIAKLKGSSKVRVVERNSFNIPIYNHYVYIWRKGNTLKIKFNVCPLFNKRKFDYDNYGWQLVYSYVQLSLFALDFRYYYLIDLEKKE